MIVVVDGSVSRTKGTYHGRIIPIGSVRRPCRIRVGSRTSGGRERRRHG